MKLSLIIASNSVLISIIGFMIFRFFMNTIVHKNTPWIIETKGRFWTPRFLTQFSHMPYIFPQTTGYMSLICSKLIGVNPILHTGQLSKKNQFLEFVTACISDYYKLQKAKLESRYPDVYRFNALAFSALFLFLSFCRDRCGTYFFRLFASTKIWSL